MKLRLKAKIVWFRIGRPTYRKLFVLRKPYNPIKRAVANTHQRLSCRTPWCFETDLGSRYSPVFSVCIGWLLPVIGK